MRSVSRRLGKNDAYIQQYLERERPKVLPEQVRRDLAAILHVQEDEIGGMANNAPSGIGRLPKDDFEAAVIVAEYVLAGEKKARALSPEDKAALVRDFRDLIKAARSE